MLDRFDYLLSVPFAIRTEWDVDFSDAVEVLVERDVSESKLHQDACLTSTHLRRFFYKLGFCSRFIDVYGSLVVR